MHLEGTSHFFLWLLGWYQIRTYLNSLFLTRCIYIDFYKALKKIEDTSVRIRINYFPGFSNKIIKYISDWSNKHKPDLLPRPSGHRTRKLGQCLKQLPPFFQINHHHRLKSSSCLFDAVNENKELLLLSYYNQIKFQ